MHARTPHGAALAIVIAFAAAVSLHSPAEAARPPAAAEAGVLTVGARGPVVRALQRELRRRGIPVAVDGAFGHGTRRAVARLQRRLGLRVNGLVDRPLLWWLGIPVCALPGPTTARGGARDQLRLGAYGPRVCALQRALGRAGTPVAVDGGFGPRTRAAVRRAQRRVGLPVTGIADDRLLARLRARAPAPATPRRPVAGALLSVGARGPAVRRLQAALRSEGFGISVDGRFGPRTRRAVARMQRRLGRPVSGAVDATLLRRLSAASRPRHLMTFPVEGPVSFQDDYGAPRHQGRHEGNDIFGVPRAGIVAVADGVIGRMTRTERGLGGIYLWLIGDGGTAYYYAHLSSIAPGLAPGARVSVGQRLGAMGNTGDARRTIPHLHFEVHPRGGRPINPYRDLRAVSLR